MSKPIDINAISKILGSNPVRGDRPRFGGKINMSKPKKATAGERIVLSVYGGPPHAIREYQSGEWTSRRAVARRIDSALRRAVSEAWYLGMEYGINTANSTPCEDIKIGLERKRQVKL